MIGALMLYGLIVGALLSGAAVLAERGLRLAGAPARLVWLAALLGTLAMPFPRIETMSAVMDRRLFRWRVATGLFGVLGGLAALLAAIGVYGLASFISDQRRRELGIRSALGAGRERLLALVLWDGAKVSGIGLAAGAALALVVARLFASQLSE
ncbi:MAG: FtsX-like permease family protein [Gemmatimonadetes bacterium]|nr:FtsX-like permease family protein [Gemmatimonadota bacterium]